MSDESVKALYYKENNIGNWLKKSKKQYVWKLQVDGDTHHIEFMDSVLSGKKKIIKNGMVVFERQLFGVPFQYPFTIGKHSLNIAMHGDKYELRVDGMSFSHLYNLTKSGQMTGGYQEEENMGAYGDYSSGSKSTYQSKKYDDGFDDYPEPPKKPSPSKGKADSFEWDNGKQQKRENSDDEDFDTGYDGWNDVKRTHSVKKTEIPDPYSSKKKYDPSNDDFFNDSKATDGRGKATTMVKKGGDFFSGGYDKPSSDKKKDFDSSGQPKAFDFDGFGENLEKKNDDFDNVFEDAPKPKKKQDEEDPFAWGNESKPKQQKKDEFGNEFEFDFGSKQGASKPKKDVADFLDDQPQPAQVEEKSFDPFAEEVPQQEPSDPLAGIQFDSVPAPVSAPVIDPNIQPAFKKEERVEPENLESKEKKLFNLGNLSKNKSKLEIHKEPQKNDDFGMGAFGNSNFGGGFENTGFSGPMGNSGFSGPAKAPETKEDKLNALESAFGTTETVQAPPQQVQNPAPVQQTQQPKSADNDFGEFPTMFGGSSDGFGNFKGFDGDAFGASAAPQAPAKADDPFEAPSQPASEPKKEKKDDWFEF
jgi:hypothetical protein